MGVLIGFVCNIFADTNNQKLYSSNPSNLGSKQGSNQIFGEQKLTSIAGKRYYKNDKNISDGSNKPTQGSSVGSNQVFGEQKRTGIAGKRYYKNDKNISDGPNKPTQGSSVGSNQVFGEPALKRNSG